MENGVMAESVHTGMGTGMAHRAFGCHAKTALRAVEDEAVRLECLLSRFLSVSDISRINTASGKRKAKISSETCMILERATVFSKMSQGLFDVTIGPLGDLWDYKHALEPPKDERIQQVIHLVNYCDLEVDSAGNMAGLARPKQSIDLGGIGKGYASDCFMEIFKEYGINSAFSNIGGNVSTLGNRPDGSPWRVGIRHPRQDSLLGAVEVTGKAVVTSGDYERYFLDRNGIRYHHILNPVTGYPADSGLISVTVIMDSAMDADALSTSIFAAGLERGLSFIEKFPQAEVVLVDKKLQVFVTQGLKHSFQTSSGINVNYI